MNKINAMGDACPIPVVKAIKAARQLDGGGEIEMLVDNEIAVQNLTKMAKEKGYSVKSQKLEDHKFQVNFVVGEGSSDKNETEVEEVCILDTRKKKKIVVISSDRMGLGNDELGKVLIKGFIYAISQQDELPETIIFYNGGAQLTCEVSETLDDIKSLEAQGVEIMTCGTCLNYYGIADQLRVGLASNMYSIAEKMTQADLIIKP